MTAFLEESQGVCRPGFERKYQNFINRTSDTSTDCILRDCVKISYLTLNLGGS